MPQKRLNYLTKKKSNENCTTSVNQINKYIQFIPTGELSYINQNKKYILSVTDRPL